jgi:threonyl-tRNA synthetase
MYPPVKAEEGDYYLKPMNCPFHVLIYKSKTRSYRDLPLRMSELGTVYRHERSGVLHGIFRPRGFTQDDSHIFCRPDQLVDEIRGVMDFVVDFYAVFGLKDAVVHLSTVDPKAAIGSSDMWRRAEGALREALEGSPFSYDVQEGEGAFYGPKIDFDYRDALGRLHQLTTIQCDFALPEQFELEYIGEDNTAHRPVMVHRALYGSVERFLGVYLEHTAGAFPPWVAPIQIRVVQMRDAPVDNLVTRLRSEGLRVDVDDANETMQYKVRRGALEKIPWLLVIGPKEVESATVSVRTRDGKDTRGVPIDEFIASACEAVSSRAVDV